MGVINVKQPTPAQIKFWESKGWKHLGFGKFRSEHNQHGMIHFHKDGRTGMKINNYCIVEDDAKVPSKG